MSDCASEVKSPIKKLKEKVAEPKELLSSLVERRKISILTKTRYYRC